MATPYCSNCEKEHEPTTDCVLCEFSHGMFLHAPMPKDIFFDFKGWRFTPPFHCFYCGIELCHEQWAFSRSCGPCDCRATSNRVPYGKRFAGPHELIDRNAQYFLSEDGFISPSERDKYFPKNLPRLQPRKPYPRRKPDLRPRAF